MTKDETLRMALEALDALCINDYSGYELGKRDAHLVDNALTAIKKALAQSEPEPVAFKIYKPTPPRGAIPNVRDAELPWVYDQDPSSGNVASMWVTPVKATPSQHEWVGLTDEEARVKFESWHKAEYVQPLERYGHTYKNMHVRNRWQGWLAANGIKEKNT